MFVISNPSNHNITIDDLNIIIKKNQALDLHTMKLPIRPENSVELKTLLKKGKILHMNRATKAAKKQENAFPNKNKKDDSKFKGDKKEDLDLRNEIKNILHSEFSKLIDTQKEDKSSRVLDEIKKLSESFKEFEEKPKVIYREKDQDTRQHFVEDDVVDDDKLSDIHARTLDRVSRKTEKKISYDETKVDSSGFDDNISELEGLL